MKRLIVVAVLFLTGCSQQIDITVECLRDPNMTGCWTNPRYKYGGCPASADEEIRRGKPLTPDEIRELCETRDTCNEVRRGELHPTPEQIESLCPKGGQ